MYRSGRQFGFFCIVYPSPAGMAGKWAGLAGRSQLRQICIYDIRFPREYLAVFGALPLGAQAFGDVRYVDERFIA